MKRLKQILYKLLHPGTVVVLLSIPVAIGLLAYTFLVAGEESPISYPAYILSAYSLAIVCQLDSHGKKVEPVDGTASLCGPLSGRSAF